MSDGLYEALKGTYWEEKDKLSFKKPKISFWQKLKSKLKQIKL